MGAPSVVVASNEKLRKGHHAILTAIEPEEASTCGCTLRCRAAKLIPRVGAVHRKERPVESASAIIDQKVKELGDWRGKMLAKVRDLIHQADPEIVEEWKWAKAT